jgi:EpsI family protein
MKIETTAMLSPDESATIPEAAATGWRTALPALVLAIVAILAVYWQTAESIEGDLVAIGNVCARLPHRPDLSLAHLDAAQGAGAAHPIARLPRLVAARRARFCVARRGRRPGAGRPAVRHGGHDPDGRHCHRGRRVAQALAFPLGFLLLGVPVGEALIPPLMDWTADFTVTALRLSGIPVYREGTFFTIPSGQWSVVEGCSGLRYLIASITVGALFAYLSYQKTWKRLLFVVLSVIVPIIANGMRAYMIVMIAHLSDMKLALGIDHLIYGWLFFGLVMLLLFWSGSFWRDPEPGNSAQSPTLSPEPVRAPRGAIAGAAVAVVVLAGAWPLYAAHLDRSAESVAAPSLPAPAPTQGWSIESTPATDWRPKYDGATASVFQTYRKGDRVAMLYIGFYPQQRRGAELVTSTNVMVVQKHPIWANVGESHRKEDLGKGSLTLGDAASATGQRLLIWDFFNISGQSHAIRTSRSCSFQEQAPRPRRRGAAIIIAVPYDGEPDAAAETLRSSREMAPSIDAALVRVENRPAVLAPEPVAESNEAPPPLIVHVVFRFGIGGLENGIVNLINRMPQSQWRHAVVALTEVSAEFAKRIERPDVRCIALGKKDGHLVREYPRLFRLFRELEPAVPERQDQLEVARGRRPGMGRRRAGADPRRARLGHARPGRQASPLPPCAPPLSSIRQSLHRPVAPSRGLSRAARRNSPRKDLADLQRSGNGPLSTVARRTGGDSGLSVWRARFMAHWNRGPNGRYQGSPESGAGLRPRPGAGSGCRAANEVDLCRGWRVAGRGAAGAGAGGLRSVSGSQASVRTSPTSCADSTASSCRRWPRVFPIRSSRRWPQASVIATGSAGIRS